MFLSKILKFFFGRKSITVTMKDSKVEGNTLQAEEVKEDGNNDIKRELSEKDILDKDVVTTPVVEPETESVYNKIEYVEMDINDKIFITDMIRPIVKKYSISDVYINAMKDIVSNVKGMKTFCTMDQDENGNSILIINFTQSKTYNIIKEFCKFVSDTIYKEIQDKLYDLGDYDDEYRYVLSMKDSSIIISKIKK